MAGVSNLLRFAPDEPTYPSVNRLGASLAATPPLSVDWRLENKVSSVKDQGRCGSCWAFTTVGLYESLLMIAGFTEQDLS